MKKIIKAFIAAALSAVTILSFGAAAFAETDEPSYVWKKEKGGWYLYDREGKPSEGGRITVGGGAYVIDEKGMWTGKLSKDSLCPEDFDFYFRVVDCTDGYTEYIYTVADGRLTLNYKGAKKAKFSRRLSKREMQTLYGMLTMYCPEDFEVHYTEEADDEGNMTYDPARLYILQYTANGNDVEITGDDALNFCTREYAECVYFNIFQEFFDDSIDDLYEYAEEYFKT